MHLDGYSLEIECRWGRIHAKLLPLGAEPPAYDSFSPAAAVPESLFFGSRCDEGTPGGNNNSNNGQQFPVYFL